MHKYLNRLRAKTRRGAKPHPFASLPDTHTAVRGAVLSLMESLLAAMDEVA